MFLLIVVVGQNVSRLSKIVINLNSSKNIFKNVLSKILNTILHLEIPKQVFINNVKLIHPYSIIIHPDVIVGKNVKIFHEVTIGKIHEGKNKGVPKIGDNVVIYPKVIILGNINIGNNVKIYAGSVITKDIQDDMTVFGNEGFKNIDEN